MQLLSRLSISVLILFAKSKASTCYGTTSHGSLLNGIRLPLQGDNYVVYSHLGWVLGRTYVHSKVAAIILQSYEKLMEQMPDKQFMYAETGWIAGGDFAPHKTHQNGLSVDFMVPVVNESGQSTVLPISVSNKFGYAIEFDQDGGMNHIL